MRRHLVHVYEDHASFLAHVGGFLSEGARLEERIIVFAKPDNASVLMTYVRGANCQVLDAKETLSKIMQPGHLDEALFDTHVRHVVEAAAREGPVRVYGEMVQVLAEQDHWDAAVRLERLWNNVDENAEVALMCSYSLMSFLHAPRDKMRAVCVEHATVSPASFAARIGGMDIFQLS